MQTRTSNINATVQAATSAPLIERSIERATGIVYNITGGRDLTLQEVNRRAAALLLLGHDQVQGFQRSLNSCNRVTRTVYRHSSRFLCGTPQADP